MPTPTPVVLKDPRALKVLASPVSQELIDTLESAGRPLTVAELGQQLGKHADGLYYHLRRLLKAGLLVELADDAGAKRYRTAAPGSARLQLLYPRGRSAGAQPVHRVVKSLLRMAERDFERSLRAGNAAVTGPKRELWAGRVKGWVNGQDLAEINRLIERLRELLHQPRSPERNRLLAAAWVLAPVAGQSGRRTPRSKKP